MRAEKGLLLGCLVCHVAALFSLSVFAKKDSLVVGSAMQKFYTKKTGAGGKLVKVSAFFSARALLSRVVP